MAEKRVDPIGRLGGGRKKEKTHSERPIDAGEEETQEVAAQRKHCQRPRWGRLAEGGEVQVTQSGAVGALFAAPPKNIYHQPSLDLFPCSVLTRIMPHTKVHCIKTSC